MPGPAFHVFILTLWLVSFWIGNEATGILKDELDWPVRVIGVLAAVAGVALARREDVHRHLQ